MKIKNNIDLKVLRHFGYREEEFKFRKEIKNYNPKVRANYYLIISKETRFIKIFYGFGSPTFELQENHIPVQVKKKYVQDLLSAGLIEMDRTYYIIDYQLSDDGYNDGDYYYTSWRLYSKTSVEKYINRLANRYKNDLIHNSIVIHKQKIHGSYELGTWSYNFETKQWETKSRLASMNDILIEQKLYGGW